MKIDLDRLHRVALSGRGRQSGNTLFHCMYSLQLLELDFQTVIYICRSSKDFDRLKKLTTSLAKTRMKILIEEWKDTLIFRDVLENKKVRVIFKSRNVYLYSSIIGYNSDDTAFVLEGGADKLCEYLKLR